MEKEKKKEILNLVIANNSDAKEYIDYLNIDFDVNIIDNTKIKRTTDIDLVLFTGGEDVNPQYYNEAVGQYTRFNNDRDNKEIDIFHYLMSRPKLGICRGSQLLTVLSKGKLIQHVEGHGVEHKITINGYGTYSIPSTHHQMMYPFNLSEDKYEIKGWSNNFLSTTYLNGKNTEIKLPNNFLEPEIVEYFGTKSLCIQGHPELGNDDIKILTLQLIRNFLNKFKVQKINPYYVETDDLIDKVEIDSNNDWDEDWKKSSHIKKGEPKQHYGTIVNTEKPNSKRLQSWMDSVATSTFQNIPQPIRESQKPGIRIAEPIEYAQPTINWSNYLNAVRDHYSKTLSINKPGTLHRFGSAGFDQPIKLELADDYEWSVKKSDI